MDVCALVLKDVERVLADWCVWDLVRILSPAVNIPGDGVQVSEQLACCCPAEAPELTGAQRRRVARSRKLNCSDFKARGG